MSVKDKILIDQSEDEKSCSKLAKLASELGYDFFAANDMIYIVNHANTPPSS